jgi:hypothetical protein
MTMHASALHRTVWSGVLLLIVLLVGVTAPAAAEQIGGEGSSQQITIPESKSNTEQQTQVPAMSSLPMLFAEGSNSCEIVSCGMGIKQTCQITCPEDKTPKCSCDCERNIGPLCMDYKANCRCE